LENLQELFPEANRKIVGKIVSVNLNDINTTITEAMSYCSDDGQVGTTSDKTLIKNRVEIFWKLIEKQFNSFPCKTYEHLPSFKSYFFYGVMWSFCYIFLKDGKGFVLDAGAFD